MSVSLSIPSSKGVRACINAKHLDPAVGADYRTAFLNSADHMLVLDRFLTRQTLTQLQERMRTTPFQTVYNLVRAGRCSRSAFEAAPDEERLGSFLAIDESFSAPAKLPAEQRLRKALSRAESLDFFSQFVGPLKTVSALNCNAYECGHFLRPHRDSDGGRKLCIVLYLRSDWQSSFGGALVFQRGTALPRAVEPICNRIVIFEPGFESRHWVDPVTQPGWRRWSISAWFV